MTRPTIVLVALLAAGCAGADRPREVREAAAVAAEALRSGPEEAALEEGLAAHPTLALVREAALRRNPDVAAALERWTAALERAPQRAAPPYPSVRYGYSSMFLMNTFEVMQEIPFPAKLAHEARAAAAEARALGADFRARQNLLRAETDGAYAGLHLARRETEILDENLEILDRFVAVVRTKYAAGAATQPDLLRAELERDALRADRAAAAREAEAAASGLNALLDRAPGAAIGPLGDLPRPETASAAPLLARALERRPELAAAADRAAAAEAALARARDEWIPDLTIGGAYVRDFGMHENEVELSAGVTLPIWFGRIEAGIAEAEASAREARAEARAVRARVLSEVQIAAARTRAAAERWRILAEDAVPRARQNVAASEAAYMAGQIDFVSLLDAQRMLLAEELAAERALAEHAARRAELARAVGGEE